MTVLKTLGKTLDSIAQSERLVEMHRTTGAMIEGITAARSEGASIRRESMALQEETLDLTIENKRLNGALKEARNLLEEMGVRNEAFVRTIVHLRKVWAPAQDQEIKVITDNKFAEVRADANFARENKASIDAQLKPKMKR